MTGSPSDDRTTTTTSSPPDGLGRWRDREFVERGAGARNLRRLEIGAAIATTVIAGIMMVIELSRVASIWPNVDVAADYHVVVGAAARWLDSGAFYLPEQIAGPYEWPGPWVLYPPPALLLFVPFTVLPAPLWWAIPIVVISWVVFHHWPRPLALAAIALIIANPTTISSVVWGNPVMWIVAALALGTVYGWPSVAVFIKPSLFPFAFVGATRRSWWFAAALGGIVSLAFLPMWADFVAVALNARAPSGWFGYSTAQIPMMLLPIAAWLGRRR